MSKLLYMIDRTDCRSRLITKGYRMEKRFIPLQCPSLRIFCYECEHTFVLEGEVVPREKGRMSVNNWGYV